MNKQYRTILYSQFESGDTECIFFYKPDIEHTYNNVTQSSKVRISRLLVLYADYQMANVGPYVDVYATFPDKIVC